MSFCAPRTLRIFICTRNRPRELEQCLSSLAHSFSVAFPGQQASCYVFDDSTQPPLSFQTALLCHHRQFLNLHIQYVRTEEDIAKFLSPCVPFPILRPYCKPLGRPAWDLAGVRNLAFLCALSCSHDDDLLLFLDDDIRFESASYYGHWIAIDGVAVLHQLAQQTPLRTICATGVGYYGRHDTSVRQHLSLIMEELRLLLLSHNLAAMATPWFQRTVGDISQFPSTLPLRLNLPTNQLAEGGPGISGAVLATTPATLRSHGLPRWYNEDWIWLTLLGRGTEVLHKIEAQVLHAAPPQAPLTQDFLCYQLQGDIIYTALDTVLQNIPPHLQRLASCQDSLSPSHLVTAIRESLQSLSADLARVEEVRHLLHSFTNHGWGHHVPLDDLFQGMHAITSYLEEAFRSVTGYDPFQLWEEIQQYFDFIALWRTALH